MRRLPLILSLVITLLGFGRPDLALAGVQDIDTWVEYTFGEQITFQAILQSDVPVDAAMIFFHAGNDTRTTVDWATVNQLDETHYELLYIHDMADYTLRTFSWVEYRFDVTLEGGEVYESPNFKFYYEDNRFNWQTLEETPLRVHWHEGDIVFAQSVLDIAQEGLLKVQSLLPLPTPDTIEIYVYPSASIMQETLNPSTENWVAGHADPALGVMVVALPASPEQRLLMEQRIPHELMHIMLYQYTGLGYTKLPTWLSEGLASIAELYPSPDYRLLLDNAIQRESLLPMSSLCETFPRDASGALLSYAQAASFTRFLFNTYGTSGIQELVNAYANGLDCERGAKAALGVGLTQLERQWRSQALAENVALTALNNLLPWLILLIAALAAPLILAINRLRQKSAHEPSKRAIVSIPDESS